MKSLQAVITGILFLVFAQLPAKLSALAFQLSLLHKKQPNNPSPQIRDYALSVRFVGTRFHGYQVNPTHPTIEGALQDAVKAAGFAAWKGAHIKGKNTWSASSRTDSRVHAARILVVAPLNNVEDERSATDSLNSLLPQDIQVSGMVVLPEIMQRRREKGAKKAEGGLDARFHCSHREYEYFFPREALRRLASLHRRADAMDQSAAGELERLSAACEALRGSRSFHNFCHVPRIPTLRRFCRLSWDALPFTKEKVRTGEGAGEVEVMRRNSSGEGGGGGGLQRWPPAALRHSRCEVYRCEAGAVEIGGAAYYRISLAGSGFLYNQVRHMAGAAMAVGAGALPLGVLEAAVGSGVALRVPLAPACGLVLRDAGFAFAGQLDGEREGPLLEMTRAQMEALHAVPGGEGASGEEEAVVVEGEGGEEASRRFYEERILPAVGGAWRELWEDEGAGGRERRVWELTAGVVARWTEEAVATVAEELGAAPEEGGGGAVVVEEEAGEGAGGAGGGAEVDGGGESAGGAERERGAGQSREERALFVGALRAGERTDVLSSCRVFPRRFPTALLLAERLLPGLRARCALAGLAEMVLERRGGLDEGSQAEALLAALRAAGLPRVQAAGRAALRRQRAAGGRYVPPAAPQQSRATPE